MRTGRTSLLIALFVGIASSALAQPAFPTIIRLPYPARAMLPTMRPGDMLDIDTSKHQPRRGDIVAFYFPGYLCEEGAGHLVRSGDPSCVNTKQPVGVQLFAMRVIGMPGDRVGLKGDRLTLNGTSVLADLVGLFEGNTEASQERRMLDNKGLIFEEHLLGQDHLIARMSKYSALPSIPNSHVPPIVPIGCYLVLGDNRNDALDSRWWGCMPEQSILGVVVKITRPMAK